MGRQNVFHFVSEKNICRLHSEIKLFHLHLVDLGDNLTFICFCSSGWFILINQPALHLHLNSGWLLGHSEHLGLCLALFCSLLWPFVLKTLKLVLDL